MKQLRRRAVAFIGALGLCAALPLMLAPSPASAAEDFTFSAAAQAPVFQIDTKYTTRISLFQRDRVKTRVTADIQNRCAL